MPFPDTSEDDCKKKESSGEAGTINSGVQRAAGAKVDIDGRKLESSSNFDTSEGTSASGVDIDRWPSLSLSNAAKTDRDSFGTSMPNSLTDITKLDLSAGGEISITRKNCRQVDELLEILIA